MRKTFLPLFLFFAFAANAQPSETVDLRWKITDTLTYKTVMKDKRIEEEKPPEEVDTVFEKANAFFKALQAQNADLNYKTRLFPDRKNNIDIEMLLCPDEADTTLNIFSATAAMNGNIVLRGKISREGELLSFYYKSSQNNLISVLFELPTKPVKVGDTWPLQVDMINMDQGFIADSLSKKNEVLFEKTVERNGDKLAVLKYDIEEYVSGDLGYGGIMNMLTEKNNDQIYMKISHQATGLFSIEKGMWVEYDGKMEIETNFSMFGMAGKTQTEFRLVPE